MAVQYCHSSCQRWQHCCLFPLKIMNGAEISCVILFCMVTAFQRCSIGGHFQSEASTWRTNQKNWSKREVVSHADPNLVPADMLIRHAAICLPHVEKDSGLPPFSPTQTVWCCTNICSSAESLRKIFLFPISLYRYITCQHEQQMPD